LEARIEPPLMTPGRSPVVGVVRSGDGKVAWLTIQLRAELFSDSVASQLSGSDPLRPVLDDTFPETHLQPQFREFFQRKFRTAYIFNIDRIESTESNSRLARFFELLTEAWACLSARGGLDDSDSPGPQLMKVSGE